MGIAPTLVGTMVPIPNDKRQHVHETMLELLLLVTLLPNCLMLLNYLRNNMLLQHRCGPIDYKQACQGAVLLTINRPARVRSY